MKNLIVAIDGPSGAGKGTVAKAVAAALGVRHIDTGAMYRAVGWKAVQEGVPLDDERRVAAVADRTRIEMENDRVRVDGDDWLCHVLETGSLARAVASTVARGAV